MCYYNGQKVTRAEYLRLKQLERATAKYNFLDKGVISGFTDIPIAVIVPTENKTNFDVVQMEWGFIPNYLNNREEVRRMRTGYKDDNGKWIQGQPQLNAKSENLFVSERSGRRSMFYDAAKNRRCLILSTGYFDWRHIYRINKRTGEKLKTPDKYPYYVSLPEHEYFYTAGIWNPWTDRETGEMVNTVAMVTAVANLLTKQVHNSRERMPAILNDELAWRWIMEDLTDEEILKIAATQYPYEQMSACSVASDFLGRIDPTELFVYPDLPAIDLSVA
ncbi:MAG TPA: SOS response-associated peptidase family protein [Mucilaginibacter sp.]|jgi:putative SOS response-associated peptidase YedK|nr:SOS response-associated peptidase family protein [Mucilaginibacter sp.]